MYITLNTAPVILTEPESTSVVLGKTATFAVAASGENLSYQWQFKQAGQDTWNDWSGRTTATISFRGISTNNGYQYRCVVSNEAGSVTSEAAELTVEPPTGSTGRTVTYKSFP